MTRRVLLVEIGTEAELPPVTPVVPRPPASWAPDLRPDATLPPPTGLLATPVADGALLSWMPSAAEGARSIVESAPDVDGAPGVWTTVETVDAGSYMLSIPTGKRWARVRGELNGRLSAPTSPVLCEPVKVGDLVDEIADLDEAVRQFIDDLQAVEDLANAVAAQAAADAAALNARADDLRDDIDATIAEVSTLADTTDDLGTELTRVETESVERDTATTSTISLLGARNGAGTAFVLNANTTRVSPTETLAEWRNSIQGSFAAQSSRIDSEVQALQDSDEALATTLATVQATANNAATKAELTSAQNTLAAADQALSERVDLTRSALGNVALVENGSFELDLAGWRVYGGRWDVHTTTSAYHGNKVLRYTSPGSDIARTDLSFEVEPGDKVLLRGMVRPAGTISLGGRARITVRWFDKGGQYLSHSNGPVHYQYTSGAYVWTEIGGEVTAPAGAATGYVYLWVTDSTEGQYYFDAIDAVKLSLADQATASLLALTRATVDDHGDTLTAHTAQLQAHTTEIEGKASTSYVQSVEGMATAASNAASNAQGTADGAAAQASANLTAINGMSATVGQHTASINELREVSVSAVAGNAVINPSFEADGGWELSGTDAQIITTSAAITGSRALRIQNGNGTAISLGRAKVKTGQRLRLGGMMRPAGSFPNSNAKLRLVARRYNAAGSFLAISTVAEFARPDAWQNFPFEAPWTVPSGTAEVALQLQTVDHTSGGFTIDDVYLEPVSETLADVLARYSLAVTAGGDVAGMQLMAGEGTSAIRFLSETVGFYSSDGGFELANGRQIARSNGYMRVEGKPFGASGDLLSWYGPEQSSLSNCTKANGLFWLDNNGDGYFAGRVLQGVLRWFNSTTSTSNTASVTTGSNPRLGKQVALQVRYQYQRRYRYRGAGASVTPGSGDTSVTLIIERRYGSGSWTTLLSETVPGSSIAYNGEAGEQLATWTNTIDATRFATDAASTTNSEYRARITSRSAQSHSGTGTADPVQISQYLSIEAME